MLKQEFVKELFELCKKHKVNLEANIIVSEHRISHYNIHVTGEWEIRSDVAAVEVFEHYNYTPIYSIKGDKNVY